MNYLFNSKRGVCCEKEIVFCSDGGDLIDIAGGFYCVVSQYWAVKNGITNGTGNNQFSPNKTCSRAELVTFLWNLAGKPDVKLSDHFGDVSSNSYYAKAVSWALQQKITAGTGENTFSPNENCTRAQAMTFIWRYAGSADSSISDQFTDVAGDRYYSVPVGWAVKHGVTSGTSATTFSPNDSCIRGQAITFLYRLVNEAN